MSDINRTTEPTSSPPEPEDLTIEEIKRRLRDPSRPILLVGESETLSTTLALAAMRGSFHNIWSSSYPVDELSPGLIDFIQLILENINRCSKQFLAHSITSSGLNNLEEKVWRQHYATLIAELIHMANSEVDALLIRLSLKVDATKLSDPDIPPESKGIIWFNFPWSQTGTATLLQEFVKSAAGQQIKGQLLVLGLTRNPIWTPRYELPALLNVANLKAAGYNEPHKEDIKEVESFLGECVKLGYRHTSSHGKDAHFYIVDNGSDLYILVKGKLSIADPWSTTKFSQET
jgi:hypothetical protein